MTNLDRPGLEAALERFSRAGSVFRAERVCLAASGGLLPTLTGRAGFVLHWTGSPLPWFLRPLGFVIAASRCVVELTTPEAVLAFAREADDCFMTKLYSFSRELLPAVIAHVRCGGFESDVADVADRDATFAEVGFNCDGSSHDSWLVWTRRKRNCPSDLAECLDAIDD